MNRRPGAAATEPDGSGVRSAERLARYDLSASSGGRVGVTVVVHCRPKERPGAIGAGGAGWTLPRAGGNILMPSVERSPFHQQVLCPRTRLAPPRFPSG